MNTTKTREDEVIKQLYIIRAATAKQLAYLLHPELVPEQFPEKVLNQKAPGALTNLYPVLHRLLKKKLVEKVNNQSTDSSLFYLSRDGMERAYELLDIAEGHVGKGFGGDYGHFSHDNAHVPPLKQVNHFLTAVEFIIKMKTLASRLNLSFDYCDNRYSVISYKAVENGKDISLDLKPDLLIFLNGRCIAIEVDLKTERGEALDAKFKRYRQYLEYTNRQNGKILFGEVWFITRDETTKRRWFSVCESFTDQLYDLNHQLNLKYISLYQINEDSLRKKTLPSVELIQKKMHPFLIKDKYIVSGLEYYNLEKLENSNILYAKYTHQTILVCIPIRAYESFYIWSVLAVFLNFRNSKIDNRLYFVLCYIGEKPKIPVFYNCKNKRKFQEAYQNVILLDVHDTPKFFNIDGKEISESNPIKDWVERSLKS